MKTKKPSGHFYFKAAWRSRVLLFGGLLAMVSLFFASRAVFVALAQIRDETQKRFGKAVSINEPFEITEVFDRGERHPIGETFSRNDKEWLQDFKFRLKNKSGKQIIYIGWQLEFPETAQSGSVMAYPSNYGPNQYRKPKDYEKEVPIAPGDTVELGYTPKDLVQLKAFVEKRHLLQSLTRADIRIIAIHYGDGTGWDSGITTKQDPQNSTRYIPDTPEPEAGSKVINRDVYAQTNDKIISLGPKSFLKPQIKIKQVRVGAVVRNIQEVHEGDALRSLDESFKENSDWLGRTSFQIENVSEKAIVNLTVNIWFPETRATGNVMVYPISFGNRPGSKFQIAAPFLLKPGEKLEVSLSEKYADIARFVGQRGSIDSINQIQLQVSFIAFDDGTAWNAGTLMIPDPNNPDRYIPVEATPL